MPTPSLGRRLLALLIDWVIALLAVALLTGLLGFTIGKRLLRMRVEGPDGRPIGLGRAALRTGLLCLVIPAILQNDEGRGFHDIAASSRVVRV